MTEEESRAIERSRLMLALSENREFKKLIIDEYLKEDILEIVEGKDLDNPKTIDELKARQKLIKHIKGIISEGEILLTQLSERNT